MNRIGVTFLAIMVLIILGLLLVFTGGSKKPTPKSTAPVVMVLPDYANTDATTTMTIDGIVNGDDLHRAIRITVGENTRELDIIQGYSGHVLSTQTFYNSQDAYAVFLRAINNGGFLSKLKNTKAPADERGQCALGNRYIFELDRDGKTLSHLWASDCGATDATLGGNYTFLQTVFKDQIPAYQTLIQNVNLSAAS